jgi:photosystem I P700 chlorophyll a apoprotein A1
MLNHHLAGLLGLGSLAWAGHQFTFLYQVIRCRCRPQRNSTSHEFLLNPSLMAQLYPSFKQGLTPFSH